VMELLLIVLMSAGLSVYFWLKVFSESFRKKVRGLDRWRLFPKFPRLEQRTALRMELAVAIIGGLVCSFFTVFTLLELIGKR
jgi:hypothetical protein